jgi:predicted Zn-dependent protease
MLRSHRFARPLLGAAATLSLVLSSSGSVAQSSSVAAAAMSAKDRQQGAEAHPQLVAEFGGAMTGAQATYVETIGRNMAMQTGMSSARSDFTVTLLNSPVDNAFAIPGGYIYVTRQLVALMNNEAELGGVLGHEWAHIRQQHAKKRQSAATRNAVIGILGTVLSGVLLGDGQLGQLGQQVFGQGSQLLTLKYSRSQETESDNLGIEYLSKSGYDPRAMSTVLLSLANQNALDARLMGTGNAVPEWSSTHPEPGKRVAAAAARAGTQAGGVTNRDTFLARINGVMYGDDPKQGMVEGRKFTHPDLKLTFDAPNGFYMINGTRSVSIGGQSGKGEFSTGPYAGDMDAYVRAVFAALTQGNQQQRIDPGAISRTTINGIPAAYATARVTNGSSQVDVTVYAYEFGASSAFHFLTMTQAGAASPFTPMYQSVRRISAAEAAAVRPRKLVVVTAKKGDTVESLGAKMAYTDAPLDRFLVLNALTARSAITPGQKLKIIIY